MLPEIAFINKLTARGDFLTCFPRWIRSFATLNVPLQLPIYDNDDFCGVIDLVKNKAAYFEGESGEKVVYKEIPEKL